MQQPHDTQAEAAIIAACMMDRFAAERAVGALSKGDFYDQANGTVFAAIGKLVGSGSSVDMISVANALRTAGVLDDVGGAAHIAVLSDAVYSTAFLDDHIRIVQDKAVARELIATANRIVTLAVGDMPVSEAMDAAESAVMAVRERRGFTEVRSVADLLPVVMAEIEQRGAGSPLDLVTSGISNLDEMVPEFRPGELVILAARPAMGKSLLASNIAVNVARTGKAVGFFSLEMGNAEIIERILASESGVNAKRVTMGWLDDQDWERLGKARHRLSSLPLYLDEEAQATPQAIRAKCRRIKGLGLVVIDYLGLMRPGERAENRVQEVSKITRALKLMARELKVPVLALSQLNRSSAHRSDHRPDLTDLRDSGSIEQDADVVMFLHRESYYSKDEAAANEAEVIIAKQRRGQTGIAKIFFDGACCRFDGMSIEQEDAWTV